MAKNEFSGILSGYAVIYIVRKAGGGWYEKGSYMAIANVKVYTPDIFFTKMKFVDPKDAVAWLVEVNTQGTPVKIDRRLFKSKGVLAGYAQTKYAKTMNKFYEDRKAAMDLKRETSKEENKVAEDNKEWDQLMALNGKRKEFFLRALAKRGNQHALEELRLREERLISQKQKSLETQPSDSSEEC